MADGIDMRTIGALQARAFLRHTADNVHKAAAATGIEVGKRARTPTVRELRAIYEVRAKDMRPKFQIFSSQQFGAAKAKFWAGLQAGIRVGIGRQAKIAASGKTFRDQGGSFFKQTMPNGGRGWFYRKTGSRRRAPGENELPIRQVHVEMEPDRVESTMVRWVTIRVNDSYERIFLRQLRRFTRRR